MRIQNILDLKLVRIVDTPDNVSSFGRITYSLFYGKDKSLHKQWEPDPRNPFQEEEEIMMLFREFYKGLKNLDKEILNETNN